MPSEIVFGNDVVGVYEATAAAVERGRTGGGPTFLEFKTYRQGGHGAMDPGTYRPTDEVASWLARDPLGNAREHLRVRGLLDDDGLAQIDAEVGSLLDKALADATAAPMPDPSEVVTDVYA
jgi:pyruvate dehydrogenase E1 component alpha subunit